MRPTDPFDVDLPVLAFTQADARLSAALFNHSTHCIGTRTGKRSPGFYGLAVGIVRATSGTPLFFGCRFDPQSETDCDEMVRIKAAVDDALSRCRANIAVTAFNSQEEGDLTVRSFDEQAQDQAVIEYCQAGAPGHWEPIVSSP